ncbi:MAG TPA: M23 family metallopeptidase [Sphingomonadaceae bacterium]|nr:M23 family metallopeptidase [Sphingomonadaceae bacterium]
MGRVFTIVSTAVISAAITSAFWLLAFNSGDGEARRDTIVKPVPSGTAVEIADAVEVGPAGMVIPVVGVKPSQIADTFTHARAGGARVHDAIDIMAPAGTPVVAAAPGRLEKLFYSKGGGGVTAYVRSLDGKWSYYYAHLQDYAPGLKEGMTIRRGQMLGRVGYTGNANPAGPHLHFAVNRMNPGESFWKGSPVNPYPLLVGR